MPRKAVCLVGVRSVVQFVCECQFRFRRRDAGCDGKSDLSSRHGGHWDREVVDRCLRNSGVLGELQRRGGVGHDGPWMDGDLVDIGDQVAGSNSIGLVRRQTRKQNFSFIAVLAGPHGSRRRDLAVVNDLQHTVIETTLRRDDFYRFTFGNRDVARRDGGCQMRQLTSLPRCHHIGERRDQILRPHSKTKRSDHRAACRCQ